MNAHETGSSVSDIQQAKATARPRTLGKAKGKAATGAKGERRPYRARAPGKPQADPRVAEGDGTSAGSAGEVASGGTVEADRVGTATAGVASVGEDRWAGRRKPTDPQVDPDEESPDDFPADGYSLIRGKQAEALREFFADLIGMDKDAVKLSLSVELTREARRVIAGIRRERDKLESRMITLRSGRQPKGTRNGRK